jgi:5-hydroxyisourate hydrolase
MITTHVLDTARGRPAAGVPVVLERRMGTEWQSIGSGETDSDGRLHTLMPATAALTPDVYRLVFDTGRYFQSQRSPRFYPQVIIVFETTEGEGHYHVPLLISPFGFTTYRGS